MAKRQTKKQPTEVRIETIKNGYVVSYWTEKHDSVQKFFSDLWEAFEYIEETLDTDTEEDDDEWSL